MSGGGNIFCHLSLCCKVMEPEALHSLALLTKESISNKLYTY